MFALGFQETRLPPLFPLTHTSPTPTPSPTFSAGAADLADLRAHPFFEGVAWDSLRSQEAPEWAQEPQLDSEWPSAAPAIC